MGLEHEELTGNIIAAAIEVHRRLGPGFLEVIYEKALMIEFHKRGLHAARQIDMDVVYEGITVGTHRLDILVEDTIIIELKAIKNLEDIHFATLRSYLKAFGKEHGLLLNFAKFTLEVKRVMRKTD